MSATPWVYCQTVVSGERKPRRALRFASDGSCQYARIGFQPSLRPSRYALPFCEMLAVERSGGFAPWRKTAGAHKTTHNKAIRYIAISLTITASDTATFHNVMRNVVQ